MRYTVEFKTKNLCGSRLNKANVISRAHSLRAVINSSWNLYQDHCNQIQSTVAASKHLPKQSSTTCAAGLESFSSAVSAHIPSSGAFKLFKVVGDGACMFRAIAQGVQIAAKGAVKLKLKLKLKHTILTIIMLWNVDVLIMFYYDVVQCMQGLPCPQSSRPWLR
jgi:hypothetical protein